MILAKFKIDFSLVFEFLAFLLIAFMFPWSFPLILLTLFLFSCGKKTTDFEAEVASYPLQQRETNNYFSQEELLISSGAKTPEFRKWLHQL